MISPLKTADAQSGALSNVLINNTQYDFKVALINPEGKFFAFRPEAIKDLTIYDAINQYCSNGYMVYDNSYDVLERPAQSVNSANPMQAQNSAASYAFRGDARDILRIEITPRLNPNNASSETDKSVKSLFTLNFEFVVYDVKDVIMDNPNTKLRKLMFYDLYKQILSEKNIQFSTAQIAVKSNQKSSNSDRAVKTGIAIQELLKKTFPESEGFKTGFSDFDAGATDIFFTAPANYKAEDCLNYLLERHVSTSANNFDRCILKIERYPKLWSFTSLKQYFDKAYTKGSDAGGALYLETFLLGGNSDPVNSTSTQVTVTRAPTIALHFANNNTIENFSFLPSPGAYTQTQLNSKIVHSYRTKDKAFSIDSDNNDYESVRKVYYDNYVKSLKGSRGSPASNLGSNDLRKYRYNIDHIYSTSEKSPEQRLGVGRSDVLKNAIFLNKIITFRVKGATYRQSGYFIGIDRTSSLVDSSFDDNLLGIYLIVDVRHTFIGNTYYNDMVCVKTYNYKDTNDLTGNYL